MPNQPAPVRVLELGFGARPIGREGGSMFAKPGVEYFGVDFPQSSQRFLDPETGHNFAEPIEAENFAYGEGRALSFTDDSFDAVIMRGVFGQYTVDSWLSGINEMRDLTLAEAFRVLKPKGQLAIIEDNTPYDSDDVELSTRQAGFDSVQFEYAKREGNPNYQPLRDTFTAEPPRGFAYPPLYNTPYILIVEKPAEPQFIEFKGEVDRNAYPEKRRRTIESEARITLEFKKGAVPQGPMLTPQWRYDFSKGIPDYIKTDNGAGPTLQF